MLILRLFFFFLQGSLLSYVSYFRYVFLFVKFVQVAVMQAVSLFVFNPRFVVLISIRQDLHGNYVGRILTLVFHMSCIGYTVEPLKDSR